MEELIHGRFFPLEEKLNQVKNYPGVTYRMIADALDEAKERIEAYYDLSVDNPLLDLVVSVYCGSAHETFAYARRRLMDRYGGRWFRQWKALSFGADENRIRYLPAVPHWTERVRIEVVDLGAGFDSRLMEALKMDPLSLRDHHHRRQLVPQRTRGPKSAHVAVMYAAAQDSIWARQIALGLVPHVLIGGFQVNYPDYPEWSLLPGIDCAPMAVIKLDGYRADRRYLAAMPEMVLEGDI